MSTAAGTTARDAGIAGSAPLLSVEGLSVHFTLDDRLAPALVNVSFTMNRGETLALVGESGSGKSLTALSIMGLLPPAARIGGGAIRERGRDLLRASWGELVRIRGRRISMVFQEPMTSLNPVLTIGRQLTEGMMFHLGIGRAAAHARAVEMLRLVGIGEPERRLRDYPHQLSGGMRQRVLIAMAVSCEPDLVIADEPTTALDVSIQAQILDLLRDLRERLHTSILLITHDLGVVAEMADRVAVMYAGHIVETGTAEALFDAPRHPYTQGLLAAVPRVDQLIAGAGPRRLAELAGLVPALEDRPPGCPFMPRCPLAHARCAEMPPARATIRGGSVACWVAEGVS
jgi:oligopeptide/dipeptide ABC transporter ATP-binding protein